MTELVLVADRSRVRIHTFAEGLLARLAHDLELSCTDLSGTATPKDGDGALGGTANIELPLRGFAVAGVLGKDGSVDDRGLNPSERRECIAKMHHDVFHARPGDVVRAEVHAEGGSVRLRLVPPNGKSVEVVTKPDVTRDGETIRAKGRIDVSLSALGSDVVKGPMNAFRVKDKVAVVYDLVFAPRA